jgi:hypothetical protein
MSSSLEPGIFVMTGIYCCLPDRFNNSKAQLAKASHFFFGFEDSTDPAGVFSFSLWLTFSELTKFHPVSNSAFGS